jgi:hypothetical protein
MNEPIDACGWKARIDRPIFADRVNVYLVRANGHDMEIMQSNGLIRVVPEGASSRDIEPTFSLSGMDSKALLFALADALDEEGIKTPKDHKMVGTLEATRAHLADLRQMLKLK